MSVYQKIKIEPVHKKLKVRLPVEAAFRLFTEGMSRWWPLVTHSVGGELAETCIFEGWVGGHIYEVMKDGRQAEWGTVLAWEPFERVVFQWYPGRTPETTHEVTVTFSEIPGGAMLELVHTGWEHYGVEGQTKRDGYDIGWEFVLANYVIMASGR